MGSEGLPPGYTYAAPIPASAARRLAWAEYAASQPPDPPEGEYDV